MVYGAFWCAIGAVFLAMFCVENARDGWRGYAEALRRDGARLGAPAGPAAEEEDERREVPLGCTEPQ